MVSDGYEIVHPGKRAFLAAFAKVGTITDAVKAAKIARNTHYVWLDDDPEYAAAFAGAKEAFADRLEREATRRAVEGTIKPVFQGGQQVGEIREYSDTLLIFMMKGIRPEKYKDRFEHTGKDGGPVEHRHSGTLNLTNLSDAQLEQLDALVGIATGEVTNE